MVDEVKAHFFPASINYHSRTLVMSSAVDYWKSLPMLSLWDKNMLFHPNSKLLLFVLHLSYLILWKFMCCKRGRKVLRTVDMTFGDVYVCVYVYISCATQDVLFKGVQTERFLSFSSTSIDGLIIFVSPYEHFLPCWNTLVDNTYYQMINPYIRQCNSYCVSYSNFQDKIQSLQFSCGIKPCLINLPSRISIFCFFPCLQIIYLKKPLKYIQTPY